MDTVNLQNMEFESVAKALIDTTKIKTFESDPDCCPRCFGKVFEAERMAMKIGNYHRKCFSCGLCKRQLDLSLACDGPDDVFCNNCYFKNFGPVGVKYELASETAKLKPGMILQIYRISQWCNQGTLFKKMIIFVFDPFFRVFIIRI